MNFFISYDCKVFPINLYFLDIVGVCLKHFFWLEISRKQSAQKMHKKEQKKFFHFTDTKKTRFYCFISL